MAPAAEYEATTEMDVGSGLALTITVARTAGPAGPEVSATFLRSSAPVQRPGEPLVLHWGIVATAESDPQVYGKPPLSMLPDGTAYRPGKLSVRSRFEPDAGSVRLAVPEAEAPAGIVFMVYILGEAGCMEQWFKQGGGKSFFVSIDGAVSAAERDRRAAEAAEREAVAAAAAKRAAEAAAAEAAERAARQAQYEAEREAREAAAREERDQRSVAEKAEAAAREASLRSYLDDALAGAEVVDRRDYDYEGLGTLVLAAVASAKRSDDPDVLPPPASVVVASSIAAAGTDLILHWGLKVARRNGWKAPPGSAYPPNTTPMGDGLAVDTVLASVAPNGVRGVEIQNLPEDAVALLAVLSLPDAPPDSQWLHDVATGGDMCLTIGSTPALPGLVHADGSPRRFNTQPRQLSSAQMNFVTTLASRWRSLSALRWVIRMSMSCVGRGGSGDLGQRIRDDILVILRNNRGWGHGSMMEQWHQKLHNNTSPDDVHICNALLAGWHSSGDRTSAYWSTIYHFGLTRERLASYEQPITSEPDWPMHCRDAMIGDLSNYLGVLKAVHFGTDLNSMVGRVQGYLDDGTRSAVHGFMGTRSGHASLMDVLGSASHARSMIIKMLQSAGWLDDSQARDLIYLELAIDADTRRRVEGSGDGGGHDGSLYAHLTVLRVAAAGLSLSEGGLDTAGALDRATNELGALTDRLASHGESQDIGLRAAATLVILRNVLLEVVDRYRNSFDPCAQAMGAAFNADHVIVSTFLEEVVRGGPAFALSALLRRAEPAVRRVAHLGPYSVIAPLERTTRGPLVWVERLRDSMSMTVRTGTVIVAGSCTGEEDVPAKTAHVVIGSTVDVLSHVAVRARNEKHGLVACLDREELALLKSMHGCLVQAKLTANGFEVEIVDDAGRQSPSSGVEGVMRSMKSAGLITPPSGSFDQMPAPGIGRRQYSSNTLSRMTLQRDAMRKRQAAAAWAVRPSEFSLELVGTKSMNLQTLRSLGLPDWIKTPVSLAIPNGAMRKVLADPANETVAAEYIGLLKELDAAPEGDMKLCPKLRACILDLSAPAGLQEALRGVLDDLGCTAIDEKLPAAWDAVKGVWASMWNERAHLARAKLNMPADDVDMAVLCQAVVDADYAFVIHTTNPLTMDDNEEYVELVCGLGESLVGNAPGQALGFTMRKDRLTNGEPIIRSYPSKQVALRGGEFIFRSDSNAEDLEGFAGAGLHDSIPIVKNREVEVDYSVEPLLTDDAFRTDLCRKVAQIGKAVEDTMDGSAQDVEGCVKDGVYYIVQARPQV
ncbi:hypothetical protein I4F81_009588 [Pyropia yezoensis]|uniref:Uncharacterized protein n=1 Tax=Pyropia yezoensis TaxID=2788 RepID=A0ACC3CBA8_PYRYE|nr:hypothetical protein I4F81_009588 [Neopyropia yezoensis]